MRACASTCMRACDTGRHMVSFEFLSFQLKLCFSEVAIGVIASTINLPTRCVTVLGTKVLFIS